MAKPINRTVIGAFVFGAVVLLVGFLLILGSGKMFSKKLKTVMFFEGSVKGLQVGSPVMFRGVKIGEVVDINLRFDPGDLSFVIPVYVEINPRSVHIFKTIDNSDENRSEEEDYVHALIKKGLRAQLQLQSIVTGQLLVDLDFYPDKPVRLVGIDKRYKEIPTISTSLEAFSRKLDSMDFDKIYARIMSIAEGIDKIVGSQKIPDALQTLDKTLKNIDLLVKKIDSKIDPLKPGLQVQETLAEARETLRYSKESAIELQRFMEKNENIGYDINRTLKEFSNTAKSLRQLADYLERHPEALLRGKK